MMPVELDGRRTYTYLNGRETGRSPPEGLLEALVKNGTVREGSTILWRLYEQIGMPNEKTYSPSVKNFRPAAPDMVNL